jgi:hypothetical protein
MELQQLDSFRCGIPESPKNAALDAGFNLLGFLRMLLISIDNAAIGVIGT